MKQDSVLKKALNKEVRLDIIAHTLWKFRRKFIIPLAATFIFAIVLVLSQPRYYTVKVMLAPEYSSSSSLAGGLGGLASMVGINMSSLGSEDAIVPMFYPDLMKSTDFVTGLFDTRIKTNDNTFNGSLKDYITKHQKQPWWGAAVGSVKNIFKKNAPTSNTARKINPFALTRAETELADAISGSINCSVDKKTDVITISTTAQDPLAAAILADTVKAHLQEFITEYRTRKTRNDLEQIEKLNQQTYEAYMQKQKAYATFSDRNQELALPSYKLKEANLENEMQLAYNSYSQVQQQLQLARARLMERTPAFTTIQNATVPVRPSGPKRMITVLVLMMLAFLATAIFICTRARYEQAENAE